MLKTSPLGEVIIELLEIESTNNYAMRLINEGMAEHGMTIRADFQTHGKGQHGNVWMAEERKNLLFTTIIDTKGFQLTNQFLLNTFACLSVAEYLMHELDMRNVYIKWPNDIYADKKKIAGILIENIIRGSQWTNAIIGVGLNINQTHFADMYLATSLALESGKQFKINFVLKHLIKFLNNNFKKFQTDPKALLTMYNAMLYKINEKVMFRRGHEVYSGIMAGVEENGQVLIQVDGKLKPFNHKEIELILE